MYSTKEKLNHYNEIKAEQHKDVDLALLISKNPQTKCGTGTKATDILYELLDYATREEIIANRRNSVVHVDGKKTIAQAKSEIKALIANLEGKNYEEACLIKHDADQLIVSFLKKEKDKEDLTNQLNTAFNAISVNHNEEGFPINGEGEGEGEGSTEEQKKTQE